MQYQPCNQTMTTVMMMKVMTMITKMMIMVITMIILNLMMMTMMFMMTMINKMKILPQMLISLSVDTSILASIRPSHELYNMVSTIL